MSSSTQSIFKLKKKKKKALLPRWSVEIMIYHFSPLHLTFLYCFLALLIYECPLFYLTFCASHCFEETSWFLSRATHIQESFTHSWVLQLTSVSFIFLKWKPEILARLLSKCCFVFHITSHQKPYKVLILVIVR